jgi:hypothetical protein
MCVTLDAYYQNGGSHFYAMCIPMEESVQLLRVQGMLKEADNLLCHYRRHAGFILEKGLDYPPHEVNYEQSIVAPAISTLLQFYKLTREEKYLDGGREQIKVLCSTTRLFLSIRTVTYRI